MRPGRKIGRLSRWSAIRRQPAPSAGPGSASASRFLPSAPCCSYQRYLNDPDVAPMDPVLSRFMPLTASQRRIGKYFLVVAGVLLLQILVGSIMAHYYSDRTGFYGIEVDRFLPFNFLRDVHVQSPIGGSACPGSGRRCFSPRRSAAVSLGDKPSSSICYSGSPCLSSW